MKKLLVGLLVLLAIISVGLAVVYFTHTAGSLPHYFPGYLKGSAHKHTKHGIAFVILAVVLLIGAWVASGPKAESKAPAPAQEEQQ